MPDYIWPKSLDRLIFIKFVCTTQLVSLDYPINSPIKSTNNFIPPLINPMMLNSEI